MQSKSESKKISLSLFLSLYIRKGMLTMSKQMRKQTFKQGAKQMPLFFEEKSLALLLNAESLIEETECRNWCVHYAQGRPCRDCAHFAPAASGYIACDGYRQIGDLECVGA